MDLFWLKELFHTQGNKKKKLYATILTGKTSPKDPYKVSKDSIEGQTKLAGGKHMLTGDVSFGKRDQKRPSRQPQLHAFWKAVFRRGKDRSCKNLLLLLFELFQIIFCYYQPVLASVAHREQRDAVKWKLQILFLLNTWVMQCHCLPLSANYCQLLNISERLRHAFRKDILFKNHELAYFWNVMHHFYA